MKRPLLILVIVGIILGIIYFLFVRKPETSISSQTSVLQPQQFDTPKRQVDAPKDVEKQSTLLPSISENRSTEAKIKWLIEHGVQAQDGNQMFTKTSISDSPLFEGLGYKRPFNLKSISSTLYCDYNNERSDMSYSLKSDSLGSGNPSDGNYFSINFKMWTLSNHGFVFLQNENPIQKIGFACVVENKDEDVQIRLVNGKTLDTLGSADFIKLPEERLGNEYVVFGVPKFDYSKSVHVLWMKVNPDGTLKITSQLTAH